MSMEDYIIHNNNFNDTHLLFCVFDGHYGHKCAEFLSNNIQQYLIKNWQMYPNMQQIFENTMEQIDKDISKTKTDNYKLYSSGSTACIALIDTDYPSNISICHVGDSRCFIVDKNNNINHLTTNHHPRENKIEYDRLKKIGKLRDNEFYDLPTWYGEGKYGVAMTRCIGDFHIKEDERNSGIFVATPDVINYYATGNDKFLILCSDGLYDKRDDLERMWENISRYEYETLAILAQRLTEYAIDDNITQDNVSVIIVQLNEGYIENKDKV
eukprot:332864_1